MSASLLTACNSISGAQVAVTEESQAQTRQAKAVLEQILPAGYIPSNLLINARRANALMQIETVNPATGKIIARYDAESSEDISRKVRLGREEYAAWKKVDLGERADLMRRLGR